MRGMWLIPLALLAILLAGCASIVSGETRTSPAPSFSTSSSAWSLPLTAAFPEAQGVRVPAARDLLGSWTVVTPDKPPEGMWAQSYSSVSFSDSDASPFLSKEFEYDPVFSLMMSTKVDCNGGTGRLAVAADGFASTSAGSWTVTTMGCDPEAKLPYTFYDKVDRIAVDFEGYLWIANDDGVFKLVKYFTVA